MKTRNGELERVSYQHARKAYKNNETVVIAPTNYNIHSMWNMETEVMGDDFDYFCSHYKIMNCCAELGRYLAYYVLKKKEVKNNDRI